MSQSSDDGDAVVMIDADETVNRAPALEPPPNRPARPLRGNGPEKCPLCGYGAASWAHLRRHRNSRLCKRLQRGRARTADSDSDDIEEVYDNNDADGEEEHDDLDADGDYSNEKDDHPLAPVRKRARRSSADKSVSPPKARPLDMAHLLSDIESLKEAIAYEKAHNVIARRRVANTQARERTELTVKEATRALSEAEEQEREASSRYSGAVEDAHYELRHEVQRLRMQLEDEEETCDILRRRGEYLFNAAKCFNGVLEKERDEYRRYLEEEISIEFSFSMRFVRAGVTLDLPETMAEALILLAPRLKAELDTANDKLVATRAEFERARCAFEESDKKIEALIYDIGVASEKIRLQEAVIERANRTLSMLSNNASAITTDESKLFTDEADNTGAFGLLSENARRLVRQLRANPRIVKEFCGIVDEVKRTVPSALVNIAPFVLNDTVLTRAPDHTIVVPQDVCSICYIDLHDETASANDPVVRTPCGHYFHASCFNGVFLDNGAASYAQLAEGIASSGKCPTCRAYVRNTELVLVPETRYFF